MRSNHRWFARLRKWRHALSFAVLPAFAWWSVSAAACVGMPMDAVPTHHESAAIDHLGHGESAHAAHDTAATADEHAGTPDCPHCVTKVDERDAAPTLCVTDGTSNANGSKTTAAPDNVKLFAHARLILLPWTSAPPPPIRTAPASVAPLVEHTPLNVRHCVFLI